MEDLILNVDFVVSELPKKKENGNQKHQRFLQRRRMLEQRGVLKQKQLPPPRTASREKPGPGHHRGGKGRKTKPLEPKPCPKSKVPTSLNQPKVAKNKVATSLNQPKVAKNKVSTSLNQPKVAKPNATKTQPPRQAKPVAKGKPQAPTVPSQPGKLVAMDCEMVGTGPGGRTSALARCSIVGYDGDVLYDSYVRPTALIVDYRTRWSGVCRHHMVDAVPFSKARQEILRILSGKIVVGHAIFNDFKALKYFHPAALTRDTSRIPLLNLKGGFPENISVSLKRLTKALLHRDIQVGKSGHSSVEDAQATMELYKLVEAEWEQHLRLNPAAQ
ncbi:I20L2 protein, partial [Centropus bengalensis]|nr:I20L2 protein [Centropus bengalensis]